ncbi:ergothioneine biosynthesis protein EgtB [Amantichitinum ursilacus]|uniref:Iron(II)-dependent oxidoreductase EgtB n=1 Tax=Amantichitinum ursilacus TaxID=857265 RepID=A0A0N0GLR2_9NEIS|nr:ergothioneine biosynthesis protein EgtB [Amantichitinum ursilacus]KPC50250.1 Iron(II)-dependent oxidoreductase EgtB [Amantichitinum ursilacus]
MSFAPSSDAAAQALHERYRQVRAHTLALAAPLSAEDQCIQSMPDASPTKWHLAHTTWFFETVLLQRHAPGYVLRDERLHYLFNSYYEALGPRHPRPLRGLITRPGLDEVMAFRQHVDAAVEQLLQHADDALLAQITPIIELGLNHEQQHQELLLTDILHAFSCNPLLPAYLVKRQPVTSAPLRWLAQPGGVVDIGMPADSGQFCFDNETPRHQVLLQPYAIANRLVTCGEFAAFIADGGYQRADLWLSDGWATVRAQDWRHPAYWLAPDDPRRPFQQRDDLPADRWWVFGLDGVQALQADAPVAQLSFYEAAAYAAWADARLPTEFEWEAACNAAGITQWDDQVWQWTRSSYDPYPRFEPLEGIAAEYNGKFMVSQVVLRGGSVATPAGHTRPTYRNFFPPAARWQFSGVRLARDL